MLTSPLAVTPGAVWEECSSSHLGMASSVPGAASSALNRRMGYEKPVRRGIVPLPNTDEGTFTRASGVRKDRRHVDGLGRGPRAQAVRSGASGARAASAQRGTGGGLPPLPFTLILKAGERGRGGRAAAAQDRSGSKTTGLAVVNDATGQVVWAAELDASRPAGESPTRSAPGLSPDPPPAPHALPSRAVPQSSTARRAGCRPRWRAASPTCSPGWIACAAGVRSARSQLELVKFDTQLMQNAEISGVEYQQGELAGYEVREYLLEKWGRKCAYCKATNVPLQIEHIVPKVRDGSNRVSNLTIACKPCNDAKGTRTAAEFGHPEIQAQAKQPLRDAAAVNATRWALYHRLTALGLPLETGTGRTDQVEPHHARAAQDALDSTPPVWAPARPTAAQDGRRRAPADHGDGTAQPPDVSDERLWLPRQGAQGDQCGRRLPHRGSSYGPSSQRAASRQASTWAGSRCGRRARATSRRPRGPCRASTSAIAVRSIAAMATRTRKERRFLPRPEGRGLRAADAMTVETTNPPLSPQRSAGRSNAAPRWRLRAPSAEVVVFFIVALVGAWFTIPGSLWNADTHVFLTASIVDRGSLNIDPFAALTGDIASAHGHFYADKAPGLSLAAVPVYALIRALYLHGATLQSLIAAPGGIATMEMVRYWLAVGLSAIPTGIVAALLVWMARRMGAGPWWSLAIGLIYGLGTTARAFATLFFSHQFAACLIFSAYVILFRVRRGEIDERWTILCGVPAWLCDRDGESHDHCACGAWHSMS